MSAAKYSVIKKNTPVIKLLAAVLLLLLQSSCTAESVYKRPLNKKGAPYTAEELAKELRSKSGGTNPIFNTPSDNDSDYTPPASGNNYYENASDNDADVAPLPPKAPDMDNETPSKPSKPTTPKMPIPQDMDEDASSGYPVYDPEEDNSGYYYQPHAKPLPKPKKDATGKPTYPIYFDN